jgi:N utilization substance protein B
VQALYALDVSRLRGGDLAASPQEAFDQVASHFEMPEGGRAFAKDLVISVSDHLEALDAEISRHARNWRVARMAAVDRNILRVAAFELVYTQTPIGVVLDEAVELARRFGSDASPAFVNGILDALAHAVREQPT